MVLCVKMRNFQTVGSLDRELNDYWDCKGRKAGGKKKGLALARSS